ncbi:MAG TPA: AAA family ATPase [Gemmataceae bacterium]|jgi:MinD-like ATPase involved in chromosome partitioning or flagellar assembly
MYIITFYSFKGGVGRTMALVNTAVELARRGRKVLLVDFDLEAPGLNTYELLRSKEPHPGIVEYVTEFRRTHRSPLVTDFIYEAQPVGKKDGRLWVMPAGRGDAEYRRMLNNLSWRTLYQEEEGFLLFEDTRLQWDAELHPDYVLIDARTGHTDIEGICTRQLADAVVVVFYPNEQNLTGLREVCRHIRAEADSGLKKKIKLHFVPSNVADLDDERGLLRRQLEVFGNELRLYPIPRLKRLVIHRRESLEMLEQPVFVLQHARSRLAREYRRLVQAIIIENPADRQGALLFLREVQKENSRLIDWNHYDWRRFYDSQGSHKQDSESAQTPQVWGMSEPIHSRVNQITDQFWNDVEVLFRVAQYLQRHGEWELALRRYDRVLNLQPDCGEALFRRAFCRRQLRDHAGAAEDFLHYLRVHGLFNPKGEFITEDEDRQRAEWNERSLLELLSISLDDFRKGLDLPAVPLWSSRNSHSKEFWLRTASEFLIRQRRWQDAIRYLETTIKDLPASRTDQEQAAAPTSPSKKSSIFLLRAVGLEVPPAFYLAMAYWGKTGKLRQELCSQAITQIQSFIAQHAAYDDFDLHQLRTLLLWGLGLIEEAADAVNQTLTGLEQWVHEGGIDPGISYWTFQKSTPREYRADCEEMQRMIRGEPVRPRFLGESAAL